MMKKYFSVILLLLLTLLPGKAAADNYYGYTEERPLVVVCDWDFQPFEFQSIEGRPSGYNIEILDLIFNRLGIPHRFVMQEWHLACEMFERHDADLIHAMPVNYRDHAYVMTQKYVNYYNLRAARHVKTPPIKPLRELDSTDIVGVKRNDYVALCLQQMEHLPFKIVYQSPKDGLTAVRAGKQAYYIWGEVPLNSKIQELSLDSIALDEVDIPSGEMHIIGFDKDLIDLIDDEFTRLEQEGELQQIYDKWFHPEREYDDASPYALFLLAGLLVTGVILFSLSRYARQRVKVAVRRSEDMNSMMQQALNMGDYHVLVYDIKTGIVRNYYNKLVPDEGMSEKDFLTHFRPEEVDDFNEHLEKIMNGEVDEWTLRKFWNKGTAEHPDWHEYYGSAILEREDGQPRYVFHAFKDITAEVTAESRYQQMAEQYRKVFDSNLMAISFYDADGWLIDLNQKMRELCEFNEERERYFRKGNLFDDDFVKDFFSKETGLVYHVCGHLKYPELGIDKYIESHIRPVHDENGRQLYYVVTARDITQEREMYMKQREHEQQLQKTQEAINSFDGQLRYLLEESNMFVWKLDISKMEIRFTRNLREAEYIESIDQYLGGMAAEEREQTLQDILTVIREKKPYQAIHHFMHTQLKPGVTWYSVSGIPVFDNDDNVNVFFGLVRDITDLMSAQQKLSEETSRAEDSGRLKAAFLANMTHEIRTPLNAIVGFSDILQMVEDKDERMELIRIIRNNCDMLLRLINDILEASNMGQSLTIEPKDIDLPQVFDDICQSLAQRVQEPGVEFLKDNPFEHYPAHLDGGRLQQMLTNFVTNAVKYTHEGHIRVGWREENEGLYFYCEDTGAGIPSEKQTAVFERFVKLNDYVQGTGLGLSICKAIVEKCNGRIGVDSEGEGKGSTFWFWIPRFLSVE